MKTLSIVVLGGAVLLAGQAVPSYAQTGDQPGSSSTGVGGGQGMNQPKTGVEKSAVDMTGGKTGIPEHYDVVPVRRGELKDEKGGMLDQTVKNPQGETLGTIEKLLKDQKTGKIEYAVLEITESKYQLPLQWSQFKQQGGNLILKATKADLTPGGTSSMTKDMSPEISQYMEQINNARQAPKAGGSEQGVTNQPASAGSMGEEKTGGGGPSGTGALPPQGQAPGFEGGNPSSKR